MADEQYPLLKVEQYLNLGGINTKASEYATGENQVLNLRNYSFERPGAWQSRPGYSMYSNFNQTLFATFLPTSVIQFSLENGSSYIVFDIGPTLYNNIGLSAISGNLGTSQSQIDFEAYDNFLYYANGHILEKYGSSFSQASGFFPPTFGVSSGIGAYGYPFTGVTLLFSPGGGSTFYGQSLSFVGTQAGAYEYTFAFVDQYGNVGENILNLTMVSTVSTAEFSFSISPAQNISLLANNTDILVRAYNSLVLGSANAAALGLSSLGQGVVWPATLNPGEGFVIYKSVRGGTLNATYMTVGGTIWTNYTLSFIGGDTYALLTFPDFQGVTGFVSSINLLNTASTAPKYLEIYNNMMFYAGFSNTSRVWHSEIGDPDVIEPEYFFDVRSGNSDYIRGMAIFQQSLLIFKKNSFHQLTGDSPETLSLQDISLEYGCLNNTAIVQYEDVIWFMDEEGIAEYNGSSAYIISYPIQKYLDACNKEHSWAFHLKKYNQVVFVVEDTTTETRCFRFFVYDYVVKGWTIYDRFEEFRAGCLVDAEDQKELLWFGQNPSLSSQFYEFGESLSTDSGFGITTVAQTRFHKRLGDSTQELWRRLFVNNDVENATFGATINFYSDYGSTSVLTRSIGLTLFQSRIDFGISAKSLSAEIIIQSTESIKINGYTVVSRYLRSV